ncbi:hypothetical protein BA065_00055 [Nanoarchaeota archaeon NZ13-N]|nr:MAG: hypothetical protein BA065_00055 [Nanoarchaeota archaeon NZ13-N]
MLEKGSENKYSPSHIGIIGVFYVCYELSKRGWIALPTTRNTKGVDIVIYNSFNPKQFYTIQVKTLTGKNPVPFGSNPQLFADFVIIVRNIFDKPEVFILRSDEVKNKLAKNEKNGRISYWLSPKEYEEFKDNWSVLSINTGER